jgi:predicted transposase YbfD/YdcC
MDYPIAALDEKREGEGFVFDVGSLYDHLSQLEDRRNPRGKRYQLVVVLVLVILGKLAGEDTPSGIAEWARLRTESLVTALGLSRAAMPCYTTYSRVLGQAVDIDEFEAVVGAFFSQSVSEQVTIAIDGKAMRGTIEPGETQGVHLLAAYVPDEGVVLLQMEVESKENEIVAAPRLLECLDLRGHVVTGDAMFAQRTLSAQVVEAGGHYLWTVKDNQPTLRADIERLFKPEQPLPGHGFMQNDFVTVSETGCAHGRFERRTITVSRMLKGYSNWPFLRQVFKLEREVLHLKSGKRTFEVADGITSLPAEQAAPKRLLALNRGHWGIENGLHYPRDVSFNEDRCRLRFGHAAHAVAIINNLVLGLIHQQDFDYIPQARRFYNARPNEALNLVLSA